MAVYTVAAVVEAVKRLIEEAADTNVVTADQLIQFIADAEQRVATETQCLQAVGAITLVENQVQYNPPTGASSIIDMFYYYPNDGYKPLEKVEPGAVPTSGNNEYPYFYYYRASKIWVFPKITNTIDDANIDVIYAKLPVRVSALTDSLSIPDDFQLVVPYLVAKLVAIKDNQLSKAGVLDAIIKELFAGGITTISRSGAYAPGGGGSTPAQS
jgi:hypothetical protein